MTFNSYAFAIFLPIVLTLYYGLRLRYQNLLLLIASWVFYGWWDARFLALIGVSTVVDYWCGIRIHEARDERARKRYLVLSLVTNLGILGFFKYFNFFVGSAESLLSALGLSVSTWTLRIILPVGISFYTFQTLSYTIDIFRGHTVPERDRITFGLYVSYFPQLVAGPIERSTELLPQLQNPRRVGWPNLQEGAFLIVFGLFKKVGLADAVAPLVDVRFGNPGACTGPDLLYAVYLFAIQIYCDFSGYTDIARGVSRLMGIDLMVNFNQPYFSTSITEFWRRWHISLSTWLRDYLYIPLGGNRHGVLKTYRNLFLTMLLGGLWHGANWTFVVWGGLQGAYLSVHKRILELRSTSRDDARRRPSPVLFGLKLLFTFHLVCFAWVFFRADSLGAAMEYLRGIASWRTEAEILPASWTSMRLLIPLALLLTIDISQYRARSHTVTLGWAWPVRAIQYAALVLAIFLFGGLDDEIPFIYFQF